MRSRSELERRAPAAPRISPEGRGATAENVLDLLTHLIDKSLVQVDGGEANEARYRMLETVRQFAREQLEGTGKAPALQERHRDFFLRMAHRAGEEWLGDQQVEWGNRLAADFDTFRLALDFAVAHPGTTARDVLGLIDLVRKKVRDATGVELRQELNVW